MGQRDSFTCYSQCCGRCVLSQCCDNVVDRCARYQRRLVQSAHPCGGESRIGNSFFQPASQHGESGLKRLWGGFDMWLCNVGNADGSTADATVEQRNVGNAIGSTADATVQPRMVGEASGCTADATHHPHVLDPSKHAHNLVDQICGSHKMRRLMCLSFHVIVGQIGFYQMPRQTCTQSCRSDLWLPQNEMADVLSIHLLSDRLVFHRMPRQTCTHVCRSDLWNPQTETAHVYFIFLSVGQIGSTKCHGTHAHIFVDLICGTHKLRRHMCY